MYCISLHWHSCSLVLQYCSAYISQQMLTPHINFQLSAVLVVPNKWWHSHSNFPLVPFVYSCEWVLQFSHYIPILNIIIHIWMMITAVHQRHCKAIMSWCWVGDKNWSTGHFLIPVICPWLFHTREGRESIQSCFVQLIPHTLCSYCGVQLDRVFCIYCNQLSLQGTGILHQREWHFRPRSWIIIHYIWHSSFNIL